jgi:hypothetical protein
MSFFKKDGLALACLAVALMAPAWGQPRPKPAAPVVGATDIFAALTAPDRPGELAALRRLRDTLGGTADAQTLMAAQAQLDQLLQAAERREGDMPPALVMSGIASRIDRAIAGLEAAPKISAAPGQPAWLVPGLAALSAALGVALVACLAGLAARGRQAEAAEELQETLKKIRRKLEGATPLAGAGAAHAHDLVHELAGAASDEAAEVVHQAAQAVERLANAARDAEARLQASVEAAELRLRGAAAISGQLHHWIQALPDRLADAVRAMQAGGLPAVEEAMSARLEQAVTKLAALPSLLAEIRGATGLLTAQAQSSAADGQRRSEADTLRIESLADALPGMVASAVRTDVAAAFGPAFGPAFGQVLGELGSGADLMAELSHLSIGIMGRLEDVVARADDVLHNIAQATQGFVTESGRLLDQADNHAAVSAQANQAAAALLTEAAATLRDDVAELRGAASLMAQAALQPTRLPDGLESMLSTLRAACERLTMDLGLMSQARQALSQDAAFIGHEARRVQGAAASARDALATAITAMQRAAHGLQTGAEAQEAALAHASRAAAEVLRLSSAQDSRSDTRSETGPGLARMNG